MKTAKEIAQQILSEAAEPADPAHHVAARLKAHHKDLRHKKFDHDPDDEFGLPGHGKNHFVNHKNDDGNEYIHVRNAMKPGHVHYCYSGGHCGEMSHEEHPEGVHHEKAYHDLKHYVGG